MPLLWLAAALPARAQEVVLFDEADGGGAAYREASAGAAQGGDALTLAGPGADRMPLVPQSFRGAVAGLLQYRHVAGGSWWLRLGLDDAPVDFSGVDTLAFYVNAPAGLPGADLPRLALEDAEGRSTAALAFPLGTRVGLNTGRTGFAPGSQTDARLTASYVGTLPAGQTRPGYPEDLLVRFSDAPADTSTGRIGFPAIPARFTVETSAGRRLDFVFRDPDGDRTLGATAGEYVEVLLPEVEGGTRLLSTWRVEVTAAGTRLPAAGDVFRVGVDNAGVDGDPSTWQRVAVALDAFGPPGGFDRTRVAAVRFASGPTATSGVRTLWIDYLLAVDRDPAGTPPPAPSGITAQPGDSSVVLRWDAAPGAAGYHVFRSAAPGGPFERLTTSATTLPHFADVDAVNGRTYTYVLRSVGLGGRQSADADPVEATPQAGLSDAFLDLVAEKAFDYFWREANPSNGLVRDRSRPGSAASIAAVGFGLSAITVGIDRGWISRDAGVARVLATLTFFWNAPQGTDPSATGYRGFFYHFLDMNTGRRAGRNELSTIDTALLLGGVLHARTYFDHETPDEARIRELADAIYERVDWTWAQPRPPLIAAGWFPEDGFIGWDWRGYNEAMILYLLALGSPTHPVSAEAWTEWTRGYHWATHYGYSFVQFPPLFGHQYSHVWYDFRHQRDAYMRGRGIDYFENSRRATLAQRAYHVDNPRNHPNYGPNEWGLTASDIPGGYLARGAPPAENDEGTLAPTAPGGSIAFTPQESAAALRHMYRTHRPQLWGPYGFRDAYNVRAGWFGSDYLGIDQGPILLMIENARTGRVWEGFMRHEAAQRGMAVAGFVDVTAAEPPPGPAAGASLAGNHPNPFAAGTEIAYVLARPGHVTLAVYDVLGREVARLVDAAQPPGRHTARFDAAGLAAGLYFYVLRQDETVTKGKMVLLP